MYVCVCGRLCTTESRQRAAFKLKYQKVVRSSVIVVVVVTSLRVVVICCWPRRCPLCALLYVRFVRFLWRIRAVIVLSSIPYIVEGSAGDSKTLNNLRNSTHTPPIVYKNKKHTIIKEKTYVALACVYAALCVFFFPCVFVCVRAVAQVAFCGLGLCWFILFFLYFFWLVNTNYTIFNWR